VLVKERVTLRLDADLAAHLYSSGSGWQSKLDEMLCQIVPQQVWNPVFMGMREQGT